eukprot:ctg_859.g350
MARGAIHSTRCRRVGSVGCGSVNHARPDAPKLVHYERNAIWLQRLVAGGGAIGVGGRGQAAGGVGAVGGRAAARGAGRYRSPQSVAGVAVGTLAGSPAGSTAPSVASVVVPGILSGEWVFVAVAAAGRAVWRGGYAVAGGVRPPAGQHAAGAAALLRICAPLLLYEDIFQPLHALLWDYHIDDRAEAPGVDLLPAGLPPYAGDIAGRAVRNEHALALCRLAQAARRALSPMAPRIWQEHFAPRFRDARRQPPQLGVRSLYTQAALLNLFMPTECGYHDAQLTAWMAEAFTQVYQGGPLSADDVDWEALWLRLWCRAARHRPRWLRTAMDSHCMPGVEALAQKVLGALELPLGAQAPYRPERHRAPDSVRYLIDNHHGGPAARTLATHPAGVATCSGVGRHPFPSQQRGRVDQCTVGLVECGRRVLGVPGGGACGRRPNGHATGVPDGGAAAAAIARYRNGVGVDVCPGADAGAVRQVAAHVGTRRGHRATFPASAADDDRRRSIALDGGDVSHLDGAGASSVRRGGAGDMPSGRRRASTHRGVHAAEFATAVSVVASSPDSSGRRQPGRCRAARVRRASADGTGAGGGQSVAQ